jgi:hypothetical protein
VGFVSCRRECISLRIDRILLGLPRNVSTCCDGRGTAARIVIRIVCDVSASFGANGGGKYGYEGEEETVILLGWIVISWRYRRGISFTVSILRIQRAVELR